MKGLSERESEVGDTKESETEGSERGRERESETGGVKDEEEKGSDGMKEGVIE